MCDAVAGHERFHGAGSKINGKSVADAVKESSAGITGLADVQVNPEGKDPTLGVDTAPTTERELPGTPVNPSDVSEAEEVHDPWGYPEGFSAQNFVEKDGDFYHPITNAREAPCNNKVHDIFRFLDCPKVIAPDNHMIPYEFARDFVDGLSEEDLFGLLGLTRTADMGAVKKAYHLQSRKYHPDKVGKLIVDGDINNRGIYISAKKEDVRTAQPTIKITLMEPAGKDNPHDLRVYEKFTPFRFLASASLQLVEKELTRALEVQSVKVVNKKRMNTRFAASTSMNE